MSPDAGGDDPLPSVAQAVESSADCATKSQEKHLTFVHDSGAWSQTKLCYLRASAQGSSNEKKYHGVERLRDLFLNRRDGRSRKPPKTSRIKFWKSRRSEGELQQEGEGHVLFEGGFGECNGR